MTEPTLAEWLLEQIAEDEATAVNVTRFEVRDGIPGNYVIKDHVLAVCAAHRRIVEAYGEVLCVDPGDRAQCDGRASAEPASTMIRALASAYADRPGYRQEWRP